MIGSDPWSDEAGVYVVTFPLNLTRWMAESGQNLERTEKFVCT